MLDDKFRPQNVQAFINNIAFPKTLDELEYFALEQGSFNVEDVLNYEELVWTTPKWAKVRDIVFFMHSKTAKSTITKLRTLLYSKRDNYTEEKFDCLIWWINYGLELYSRYGGKIFAVAQVAGMPSYDSYDCQQELFHWSSRIYAKIDNVSVLEVPVDISEFREFIFVSRQSSITLVFGKEFERLKEVISKKCFLPEFVMRSKSVIIPLSKFNEKNWMEVSCEYRRAFFLESQFRSYYVDYFLRSIGDKKTFFTECRCIKNGIADSFVDNAITFNGKFLPVEVKLVALAQCDIKEQLAKYCNVEKMILENKTGKFAVSKEIWSSNCLLIDTEKVYLYFADEDFLKEIIDLDSLKKGNHLDSLRKILIDEINSCNVG